MPGPSQDHRLLILSQHYETYKALICTCRLPGLTCVALDDPQKAIEAGKECDIAFGEPSLLSQVINDLPAIEWVQATWAGVEPLLRPGIRGGFILTNARDVYGAMMSEYVFGYLLFIERRILARWQAQQRGEWDEQPYGMLKGRLLGLLGVGTIGAHLAHTAHQLGMQVHGYTRASENCRDVDRYFHPGRLLEFANDLDYLVCCLPGTPATHGMVDKAFLEALPTKAWLVNIGRGSTVDEMALVEALRQGSIAGAVLDVFSEEPLPGGHPLWTTPNTFITAHTAARNYPPDITKVFIENYQRYLRNEPLRYRVSFELGY